VGQPLIRARGPVVIVQSDAVTRNVKLAFDVSPQAPPFLATAFNCRESDTIYTPYRPPRVP